VSLTITRRHAALDVVLGLPLDVVANSLLELLQHPLEQLMNP